MLLIEAAKSSYFAFFFEAKKLEKKLLIVWEMNDENLIYGERGKNLCQNGVWVEITERSGSMPSHFYPLSFFLSLLSPSPSISPYLPLTFPLSPSFSLSTSLLPSLSLPLTSYDTHTLFPSYMLCLQLPLSLSLYSAYTHSVFLSSYSLHSNFLSYTYIHTLTYILSHLHSLFVSQ